MNLPKLGPGQGGSCFSSSSSITSGADGSGQSAASEAPEPFSDVQLAPLVPPLAYVTTTLGLFRTGYGPAIFTLNHND